MKAVFTKPQSLTDKPFHFCPGCHHGVIHRLVAEAIDHFGVRERTIAAASVGCSVFLYDYFDVDVVESPHGRAPAVATGIKRTNPEKFVFIYQGDGDLAAIGTAEIIHAANRGENLSVIFVNNTVYGMTGGQMAPTTLLGQPTTTSPYGREFGQDGYPIKMTEMLSQLEGVGFAARVAVDTPARLAKARKAVFQAFETQLEEKGMGFVEILSSCPTNWGMKPLDAVRRIEREMIPYFPLGVFKERKGKDAL
ncbi:MAG: 2-oxoglutarate oxidoreductase [Candidatus Dadabacteria bacterium]|nr:MAG: 2-oxoglutarate oxidoreductase [Candidatus Dadabacteria bacterium]